MFMALVAGAAVMRGWEQSKRRSTAAWQQARQSAQAKRTARDTARKARGKARTARMRTARTAGPRDPLWWPYAAGWVLAGAARAGVAAIQGAREGAPIGAREGRKFGRTAAARGWKLRRAWDEYRRRRATTKPAGGKPSADPVDETVVEPCPACGVYVTHLVSDPLRELGRVCAPCADWRAAGDLHGEPSAPEQSPEGHERCDGTCANPDDTPEGACGSCGGAGELVWNFSNEHGHTPCKDCNPAGQGWTRPRVGPAHDPRCSGGLIGGHVGCPDCLDQLRADGHEGSDQQLEAVLIDRDDGYSAEPPADRGCDYLVSTATPYGEYCGRPATGKWHEGDDEWFCAGHMGDEDAAAEMHICPRCFTEYPEDWDEPDCGQCGWSLDQPAGVAADDDPETGDEDGERPFSWLGGPALDDPDDDRQPLAQRVAQLAVDSMDDADALLRRCGNCDGHGANRDLDNPTRTFPCRVCGGDGLNHEYDTDGGTTMTLPANAQSAGTGEGYTDTVTTLTTLARQLAAAHETSQRLGEQLTADELDADTLTRINNLLDALDSAAPLADDTAKHVQRRHEPVASAVAEAGGSTNVARKGWYDDH